MKSYKHCLFIILGLFILGGSGCTQNHMGEQVIEGNNNENDTIPNKEKASSHMSKDLGGSEGIATAELDIYSSIIDQYIDAINHDFYKEILAGESNEWELIGADVNLNLLSCLGGSEQYKVYYALEDVDKNGIPELFIGGADGDSIPINYDMFTSDKTRAINPYSGYEFGHRTNLYLYSNGIFEVDWTNSGINHGMEFYKISSNGYSIELVESVSINGTADGTTKYYHDAEGNTEISEEEFESILQSFRGTRKAELFWVEIIP